MSTPAETPTEKTERAVQLPKEEWKREATAFAKMVVKFLALFLIIRAYVIEGYEVQGDSMAPTLQSNERILVFKLPHELSRLPGLQGLNAIEPGDIVVFENRSDGNKRYVKRVIAKGPHAGSARTVRAGQDGEAVFRGETVKVRVEDGVIYVNNRRLQEDYLDVSAVESHESSEEILLKPGEYYVLGDNRRVSKDSRRFGAVTDDRIIGKAVLRIWPLSKFSPVR